MHSTIDSKVVIRDANDIGPLVLTNAQEGSELFGRSSDGYAAYFEGPMAVAHNQNSFYLDFHVPNGAGHASIELSWDGASWRDGGGEAMRITDKSGREVVPEDANE